MSIQLTINADSVEKLLQEIEQFKINPGADMIEDAILNEPTTPVTFPEADINDTEGDLELDADGVRWDARIHAKGKDENPKTTKGLWKRKRGVDELTYVTVTNELKGITPPEPVATPLPETVVNTVLPEVAAFHTPPAVPVAPVVPTVDPVATLAPAPAMPVAPQVPTPAPVEQPVVKDFGNYMLKVNSLFATLGDSKAQNLIKSYVKELNQDFEQDQITNITQIASKPQLVANAWALLERDKYA